MEFKPSKTTAFANDRSEIFLRFTLASFGILLTGMLLFNLFQSTGYESFSESYSDINDFTMTAAPSAPMPVEEDIKEVQISFSPPTTSSLDWSTPVALPLEPVQALSVPIPFIKPVLPRPSFKTQVIGYTIKPRDTLSGIMLRFGVHSSEAAALLSLPQAYGILHGLNPGRKIEIVLSPTAQIQKLTYFFKKDKTFIVQRVNKAFRSEIIANGLNQQLRFQSLSLNNSLHHSLKKANVNPKVAVQLISMFNSQVDLSNGVPKGAKLSLFYQQYLKNGRPFRTGDVVAAHITHGEKTYAAIRHEHINGQVEYFSPSGQGLGKSFLRAPVHYLHVSSPFNPNRYHPILHFRRPHVGVDLAAHPKAPVMASSDGVITHLGRKGAYGNTVIIRHDGKFTTIYGHVSHFAKGLKRGMTVTKGQVIAFVGRTGLATGYHLHYEIRINGKAYNPMTVDLPESRSLPRQQLTNFKNYAARLMEHFKVTSTNSITNSMVG